MLLELAITCPECGTAKYEKMPADGLPALLCMHRLRH